MNRGQPRSPCHTYLVTLRGNVPLNNQLAAMVAALLYSLGLMQNGGHVMSRLAGVGKTPKILIPSQR